MTITAHRDTAHRDTAHATCAGQRQTLSPPRPILGSTTVRDFSPDRLEHARSASGVPGAGGVVPASSPRPEPATAPAPAWVPSPFGIMTDPATGEILDEVAIARALDGHRVELTPGEETELLRRAMASGYTDAEAAALLRVSQRTIARRRKDAGIETSGHQFTRKSA